jgi:hypothetical protein
MCAGTKPACPTGLGKTDSTCGAGSMGVCSTSTIDGPRPPLPPPKPASKFAEVLRWDRRFCMGGGDNQPKEEKEAPPKVLVAMSRQNLKFQDGWPSVRWLFVAQSVTQDVGVVYHPLGSGCKPSCLQKYGDICPKTRQYANTVGFH